MAGKRPLPTKYFPGRQITGGETSVSEDNKCIYSNRIGVNFSVFDFVLDVGCKVPGDPAQTSLLKIVMSPQHCKVFSQILQKNVEKYEKAFGPIPLPPATAAKDGKPIMQ